MPAPWILDELRFATPNKFFKDFIDVWPAIGNLNRLMNQRANDGPRRLNQPFDPASIYLAALSSQHAY